MKNNLIWNILFKITVFALCCSTIYLLANLIYLTMSTCVFLAIFSFAFSVEVPVPGFFSDVKKISGDDILLSPKIHNQHIPPLNTDDVNTEETEKIFAGSESPAPHGKFDLPEVKSKKQKYRDPGLKLTHKPSAEICLIGTASSIYRDIFEPLLASKSENLRAVGILATEIVAWLVDHGDVQSVVSKFDVGSNANGDEKYAALKTISLFDHSFNTCLHAYRLALNDHPARRPIVAYFAALAGLAHDLGKHPFFYPRAGGRSQYKSSEHPRYSVDAITYFIERSKLNLSHLTTILDAVAKHHQSNLWDRSQSAVRTLPWLLQQADYAARLDEMTSMQTFRLDLESLKDKVEQNFIVVDESGEEEELLARKPSRPLNLTKSTPVPPPLRHREALESFLRDHLGDCINRYIGSVTNLDLATENPNYACFTHGTDLMVRMSLLEQLWEEHTARLGVDLREAGVKFPMQAAVKGLLQYLDHIEPGLVQRAMFPNGLAFIRIQVQQGWDRWTKPANYIPFNLTVFTRLTGLGMRELEQRKVEEDDLAGRDFLTRINGWKKC